MTIDIASLTLGAASGAAAGALFFGGLWLTVRALPSARSPALLMLGSFLARTALALGIIWIGSLGRWQGILAAAAAFTLTRAAMTRRLRTARAAATGDE